eukprot:TRINITY_DN968_c1_g1_i1.p1 TRINITY_DN968_c1_g1~~TRINITY_DN968_c1_g1_i1.p1  ORF type:complete len:159 (-),score=76.68 TRINITY_DN968_c1_g1_i1:222-698(-)
MDLKSGLTIPGRGYETIDPHTLSATPGGTLFATTPGGTKIFYDRKKLLEIRNSPLSRTPPNLPDIPGVTFPAGRSPSHSVFTPSQTPTNLNKNLNLNNNNNNNNNTNSSNNSNNSNNNSNQNSHLQTPSLTPNSINTSSEIDDFKLEKHDDNTQFNMD